MRSCSAPGPQPACLTRHGNLPCLVLGDLEEPSRGAGLCGAASLTDGSRAARLLHSVLLEGCPASRCCRQTGVCASKHLAVRPERACCGGACFPV